ncbi:MAG: hypothetical protein JW816_04070 [Candidatus Buchananbacteria bacterium]|nr:hypothetical protein [Candidatus Buchananbacteria bacterium]
MNAHIELHLERLRGVLLIVAKVIIILAKLVIILPFLGLVCMPFFTFFVYMKPDPISAFWWAIVGACGSFIAGIFYLLLFYVPCLSLLEAIIICVVERDPDLFLGVFVSTLSQNYGGVPIPDAFKNG